ncbi:transglycosylase [Vermiconidia calcicola]|uniref:Transglycosylase n=1 Tax=Vermiconidia calcicola TaxID=1690605 RepID=A0ACC3MUD6_9PEZI|nr:transglycosylase [Vermiconidia calcicola]
MLSLRDILAMSSPLRLATITTLTTLLLAQPSLQQTYSSCDPTVSSNCPPNPALGRSISADFTSGASNEFTAQGNPTYNSQGASFTVSGPGEAPQLVSNWYIMFGKYEITMKAASGAGIVSSAVLQSDTLDEIDWEWLGAQNDEVQSNYFGKGQTTTYDRAAVHAVDNTQGELHTYTVEWTESQIVWQIDGSTVRVLSAEDANGQFPQSPCQLKVGAWSGGDSGNPQGTINWAQGPTDYSAGPFTMVVSSLSVTDYSTGTQYAYGDRSGNWDSIMSNGGRVNGNVGGSLTDTDAPAITSTSNGNIVPFLGGGASAPSATVTYTDYPGLPSGWAVDPESGKVIPPSSAPSIFRSALSTSLPVVSPAAHCSPSGYKTVTGWNDRGFPTTATVPMGVSTGWDDKGFPTTVCANCEVTHAPNVAKLAAAKGKQFVTTTSSIQHTALPEKIEMHRKKSRRVLRLWGNGLRQSASH